MGGRSNKTVINFRATEDQVAEIERLVKASGLSKQEYLLNVALGGLKPHTHTLLKAGSNASTARVNTASSSASSIKGLAAKKALIEGVVAWLDVRSRGFEQVLWYDGAIWLVGKTSNGSQEQLEKLLEFPECMVRALQAKNYMLREVKEAVGRYSELSQLEGIDQVTDHRGYGFLELGSRCFDAKEYAELKQKAVEATFAYKQSIEAPSTVVEPVADQTVESEEVTYTPPIESTYTPPIESNSPIPSQLTGVEFKARFGLLDTDNSYSAAVADGYFVDPDGDRWVVEGKRKKAKWTQQLASQVQPELVLA